MDAVLIRPPFDVQKLRDGESLGIRYIASVLREEGYEVEVIETTWRNLNVSQAVDCIARNDPRLIGFSVPFWQFMDSSVQIIKVLRERQITSHITMGGPIPTFHHVEILDKLKEVDSVVRFEGEYASLELMNKLDHPQRWNEIKGLSFRSDGRIFVNLARPLMTQLDSVPFPLRETPPHWFGETHFTMISSRGCYGTCSFCSVPYLCNHVWRCRSPENVVDEIEYLVNDWNAEAVSFMDSSFIGPGTIGRKRARGIGEELRKRNIDVDWKIECRVNEVDRDLMNFLITAGLKHVDLGLESGIQSKLDAYGKRTTVDENRRAICTMRDLNLGFEAFFIMFDPYTDLEELHKNLDFVDEMSIGNYKAISNRLTVYGGTGILDRLQKEARLRREGFRFLYDMQPKIEALYRIVKEGLAPVQEADTEISRMRFKLETKIVNQRSMLRNELEELERRRSSGLVLLMRNALGFVESTEVIDEDGVVKFIGTLSRNAQEFAHGIVDSCDNLALRCS